MGKENKSSIRNIVTKILYSIGIIIVAIVGYYLWVNPHGFEGDFFGMTFRMPLEKTEHYCSRKANHFLTFDAKGYQSCLREESSISERNSK